MATDLETRQASTKPDAFLRRKFAELCARIKRADLLAHLLTLALAILSYALFIGLFDYFAGNSTAVAVSTTRWIGFAGFVGVLGYLLVQAVRCLLHRVNPYFVAQQIEQASPGAKNTLINWLDMQDEEIPAAFQRNLSARAAEQLQDSDIDRTVKRPKNWALLGALVVPAVGLGTLLLLEPAPFSASMLRAFVPFYTPDPIARTRIALVQPEGGDAEVSPGQALTVAARIEGRVPVGNRPDAPMLSYRYHAGEDYLTQPLQQDAAGLWTTQLHAGQIRTGLAYKISAGDAETPEHQVRVRGRAHVAKFEITYHHRPYRKFPKTTTSIFPNDSATRPVINGFPGSEVELIVHTSRPAKKARIEVGSGNETKELATTKLSDVAFTCKWPLERAGQFRVLFTSIDGEENADRDFYPIDVAPDDAPLVILERPGKDVLLPANGTLVLEGRASSPAGIKGMTLHLRMLNDPTPLAPMIYRPGKSFQLDAGIFADVIDYNEVVPLDKLLVGEVTTHSPAPGTEIEYWLEATDATDFPNRDGNVGKSPKYKITLTKPSLNSAQEDKNRQDAQAKKKEHHKQQDDKLANQKDKGNSGSKDPKKNLDAAEKNKQDTGDKINKAFNDKKDDERRGETKPSGPQDSGTKGGPPDSPDAPKSKNQTMPPDDSGKPKDQGDGKAKSGEPKDNGKKAEPDPSKGDRKDGPKGKESIGDAKNDGNPEKKAPTGGAKGAGEKGMDTPTPQQPKEQTASELPFPASKGTKGEPQTQGASKGAEQNGPDVHSKNAQAPPKLQAKAGKSDDLGASKSEPKQASSDKTNPPGNARGDDSKAKSNESGFGRMLDLLAKLQNQGPESDKAAGELAEIGQKAASPDVRNLAKDMLARNGRDAETGKEKKKAPGGVTGPDKAPSLPEELKAAAANREFAARIGQMQLDDWQKKMSPEVLKRANVSEAEWQRYIKSVQGYGALVRELNAKIARAALKDLQKGASSGTQDVQNTGKGNTALDAARPAPPELQDAIRRFTTPR